MTKMSRAGSPAGAATTRTRRTSFAPYRIYNIGNNQPVELMDFIAALESPREKAKMRLLPMQPGDVPETLPTWMISC